MHPSVFAADFASSSLCRATAARYDAQVTAFLQEAGFTHARNTPVATVHEGCSYPPSPFEAAAREPAAPEAQSLAQSPAGGQGSCPEVSPMTGLDLEEYARASWYVAQQQVNGYQGPEDLFCIVATYDAHSDIQPYAVPGFDGTVVGVYNYANQVRSTTPTTPPLLLLVVLCSCIHPCTPFPSSRAPRAR